MAFVSFWSWILPLPPPVQQVHPVRDLFQRKWEPSGLAPIRPSTSTLPGNRGRGMGDVEIAPKYPGPALWGVGFAPQDCSADSPSPWLPACFSVSPPLHKRVLGVLCYTFPLSLRPLPALGGDKNSDFGKTLWVLTGEVRGCSTHWNHPGVPLLAPTSKSHPPTSFRTRARPEPSRSRSHPGVGGRSP